MKTKKPSKIRRGIKKDDRTFEELCDFIMEDKSKRTPEQQRNDMFKIMNKASEKNESKMEIFEDITFEELQNNIIKKGGAEADILLRMREQHEETMKELCDLCGKSHKEHDSRGFIYFHGDDHLKAGWSCVENIIRKVKKRE